ncbi:MAG: DUF4260 domain-containing protein [Pararhodobacter sp.]|nr:DUF4260 domain-containing protein [Pararhodobacter sp.]
MDETVIWQRAEGALVFAAAGILFFFLGDGFVWWVALAVFFAPDINFAAYAFGSRIGAIAYNIVHVYAFGAVPLALGIATDSMIIAQLGALWLAHSGFDRMLGYGLKSRHGFKFTHLGVIGPASGFRGASTSERVEPLKRKGR